MTPMLIRECPNAGKDDKMIRTIRECPNAGNGRPSRAEEHEEERKPCEDTG